MIETALRETGGRVSGPLGAAIKLGIPDSGLKDQVAQDRQESIQINRPPHRSNSNAKPPSTRCNGPFLGFFGLFLRGVVGEEVFSEWFFVVSLWCLCGGFVVFGWLFFAG